MPLFIVNLFLAGVHLHGLVDDDQVKENAMLTESFVRHGCKGMTLLEYPFALDIKLDVEFRIRRSRKELRHVAMK